MNEQVIIWERDGVDPGWLIASGIGSVRSSASYRPGGWWFLPDWLPDSEEFDVGPFRTKALAIEQAETLAGKQRRDV
ncbi:hypothetical protein DM806_03030 [Sphingobium lactosutens]|nr:hypothetical protein [Sphingobium lactosutens]